jgi:multiple RNA-binding domain-containing protein 1
MQAARKIDDPDAPRPWSHHSLKKSENDSKRKTKAGVVNAPTKGSKGQGKTADVRDPKGSAANDPKFQEFLEVMQPRSKAKMWANDTTGALPDAAGDGMVATEESKKPQMNVPASEDDSSSEDDSDEEMADDSSLKDTSEVQQTESKQDNQMTDMDFFKSKIKKKWSDSESDDEDSGDQSNSSSDGEKSSDESSDADEKSQMVDLKGNLNEKNNVDNGTNAEHTDLQEVDDPDNKEGEDLQGMQKETKNHDNQEKEDDEASLITDEKKLALETGRLFICNLPYATTYVFSGHVTLDHFFVLCAYIRDIAA